jgi:hypothetical protein
VVGSGVYFLADREKKQPFNIPDKGGQKQYQLLFLIKTRTIIFSIKVDNALVPIYINFNPTESIYAGFTDSIFFIRR